MHTRSVLDGASTRSTTQKGRGSRLKGQRSAASPAYLQSEMLPHLAPAGFAGPTPDVAGSRSGTMDEDVSTGALCKSALKKCIAATDRILLLVFFGAFMYFMLNSNFLFGAE
jgi:hypothetical protein